jgi:hypothetical protein
VTSFDPFQLAPSARCPSAARAAKARCWPGSGCGGVRVQRWSGVWREPNWPRRGAARGQHHSDHPASLLCSSADSPSVTKASSDCMCVRNRAGGSVFFQNTSGDVSSADAGCSMAARSRPPTLILRPNHITVRFIIAPNGVWRRAAARCRRFRTLTKVPGRRLKLSEVYQNFR